MMLSALREEVCAANVGLQRHGLVTLTWGNVSAIDRDSGRVVIKPSGVPYDQLTPASMVVLDLEGAVIDGTLSPSVDAPTHIRLYAAFPEIGGVAHTHSRYATAFAQACRELPCLGTTHADYFHGPVPLTRQLTRDEVDQQYEAATGNAIVECLEGTPALHMPGVLVPQHGPFTWGHTAEEALLHAVVLEEVAALAWHALALNSHPAGLPGHVLAKHHERKHGADAYYGQK
jgi:L-ribulose-5-phosphate 4-epimerase